MTSERIKKSVISAGVADQAVSLLMWIALFAKYYLLEEIAHSTLLSLLMLIAL